MLDTGCIHSLKSWLFVYIFVTQLGKILKYIHTYKHRNTLEHSISFQIVGYVASIHVNICSDYYYCCCCCCVVAIINVNRYSCCLSLRWHYSQNHKEDHGPSIFTFPAHTIKICQDRISSVAHWENAQIN